jgi:hypothetical protein
VIEMDDADRRVTVSWNDAEFGETAVGAAVARPGYGGIVLGPNASLQFDPTPLARRRPDAGRAWPLGDAVKPALAPSPHPPIEKVVWRELFRLDPLRFGRNRKFADSSLEGGVSCELVSEKGQIPC